MSHIEPQTEAQVTAMVLDILRDIVRQPELTTASSSMLDGCAEACRSYGMSLSSLIQEPSIEGHTPIYWAIMKRNPDPPGVEQLPFDLAVALLTFAVPLSDETISEIRLAILHNSDQAFFQRLRRWPSFSPVSGAEEMLLDGSLPPDEVVIENAVGDESAFVARFRIPMFQKRLRLSKQLHMEFIARGRLWSLRLLIATADNAALRPRVKLGTCLVTLALLEHSPPTWLDSRFVINSPIAAGRPLPVPPDSQKKDKVEPANAVRLKTCSGQLAPGATKEATRSNMLSAVFKDNQMAENLQHHENLYVAPDGSFEARLEARLAKPDADCVIC